RLRLGLRLRGRLLLGLGLLRRRLFRRLRLRSGLGLRLRRSPAAVGRRGPECLQRDVLLDARRRRLRLDPGSVQRREDLLARQALLLGDLMNTLLCHLLAPGYSASASAFASVGWTSPSSPSSSASSSSSSTRVSSSAASSLTTASAAALGSATSASTS